MSEPKDNRVPIMMSNAELEAIDNWRFENRIATRSEAIRRLCQIGLITSDAKNILDDKSLGLFLGYSDNLLALLDSTGEDSVPAVEALINMLDHFSDYSFEVAHIALAIHKLSSNDTLEESIQQAKRAIEMKMDKESPQLIDIVKKKIKISPSVPTKSDK